MIRHQRPGIAFTSGFLQASLKPGDELLPVSVIQKYIAPLYPARNNMIYCSGNLYPFMSWHGVEVSFLPLSCQVDSVPVTLQIYQTIKFAGGLIVFSAARTS